MASLKPTRPPSFFWQGLLILLPVVVLAVFGFLSLRQDRLMAEADARQRANDLADSLTAELQQEFDLAAGSGHTWASFATELQIEVQKFMAVTEAPTIDPVFSRTQLGTLLAAGMVVFVNTNNELIYPPPLRDVPSPQAVDTSALTTEQRRLWSEVLSNEFIRHDFSRAGEVCDQLTKTALPRQFAARFGYEAGMVFKQSGQPRKALARFTAPIHYVADSVTNHYLGANARLPPDNEVGESGVPLRQLALLQAALIATESAQWTNGMSEPADSLWEKLCAQAVLHPNILTEYFLNRALAKSTGREKESVETWQRVWNCHQAARAAWQNLMDRRGEVPGTSSVAGETVELLKSSEWFGCLVNADGGDKAVLMFPKQLVYQRISDVLRKHDAKDWNDLHGHMVYRPNSAVNVVANVQADMPTPPSLLRSPIIIEIPPYFGVVLDLGREAAANSLVANDSPSKGAIADRRQTKFTDSRDPADQRNQFLAFHTLLAQRDSDSGWAPKGNERVQYIPRPLTVPFEFKLEIYLADSAALYAQHRQRAWIFGGLIAACALAALVGFVAARRAFYRQLRLSEMKSNFVSSVSHELRAPIASVRLMAEGLERGAIHGAEKQNEYFRFIVQECRRLSSLIENVLDFSRIEQGRKEYELEAADLRAMTEQTVKLMQTYADEAQLQLVLQVSGTPTPVELDSKAMQQALVNLIDNAIKHSPKVTTITVGLDFPHAPRTTQQSVQLWVEDHGPGIPAAEHQKIFERFYRIGSELRRETQGAGIGLSIVKHIVEAHGGKVTVRSAVGEGSRFTIELPVREREARNNS